MAFWDSSINRIADALSARISERLVSERVREIETRRNYRSGVQKQNLKTEPTRPDDNITINLCGLVVNKSAFMLFGKGIKLNIDNESPEAEYLKGLYDANKEQILFNDIAISGAEAGTCYLRIIPNGIVGNDGKLYPRLVSIDPALIEIETSPEDVENVTEYEIKYSISVGGKLVDRKVEISREIETSDNGDVISDTWTISTSERSKETGNKWVLISDPEVWPYPFAPIVHWKNLPAPFSVYGAPDLSDDVINLQDKYNGVMSNLNKVIRLYAHPQRWSRFAGKGGLDVAPGNMPNFENEQGGIFQNDAGGDLSSSLADAAVIRQSLFAITQSVDLSSMQDKIGSLTNFGLRLLYQDALARINTKQELYGDAIAELNRRLLIMGGYEGRAIAPIWPDPLPKNTVEEIQTAQAKQSMKIVSNETIAKELGYDYQDEQDKAQSDPQSTDNIGAFLLGQFNKGQ